MKYLCKHVYRVPDGLNRKYFTVLTFKVPAPEKGSDEPVVIVSLHNAKKSIFLTFTDIDKLDIIFNLDKIETSLKANLTEILKTAGQVKAIRVQVDKEISEQLEGG